MRLLCPFCQQSLTLPDSDAGKAVNCMYCGQQFPAPQLYSSASPDPASESPPAPQAPVQPGAAWNPPPSPVVETPVSEKPSPEKAVPPPPPAVEGRDLPTLPPPDREMSGFGHLTSLPIEPAVIRWIAPAALFAAFILTFFSWDGMFPAGYPAYTQSAWGCLTGGVSKDEVAEDELGLGKDLEERVRMNWWLLPYLVLLFPALLLAWAGPVVGLLNVKLPAGLHNLWQYRPALLGVIAVVTLMFLSAQWATGFGLQRAIREKIEADFADKKAAANTPEKVQRVEMKEAMARGEFYVKTTVWLRLAFAMHLLAALAVVIEAGLTLRGSKPPPRVGVMW